MVMRTGPAGIIIDEGLICLLTIKGRHIAGLFSEYLKGCRSYCPLWAIPSDFMFMLKAGLWMTPINMDEK